MEQSAPRRKWKHPVITEVTLEELEDLADIDVVFATSSCGCDLTT